jgi:ribosomal-protein-alanine N-acetyltransferase
VRLRLVTPAIEHEERFLAAVRRSRDLHRPWVSPPASREAFLAYLGSLSSERSLAYLLVAPDEELVGVVNINEIVRGLFQSAYLGYYGFSPLAGRGLMKQGLGRVVSRGFGVHRLHRLEANIQPGNAASIALVRSLGFEREGLSPRYLKIGGRWRDHERWAVTRESWRPGARRRGAAQP